MRKNAVAVCHPGRVEVTAELVERIPPGNLRVPVAEFAGVWAIAEERNARGLDWYAGGVVMTCQWIACARGRPRSQGRGLTLAPVTRRSGRAHEELIEAEFLAAEVLSLRRPRPDWLADRDGWLEGILATFDWCWRGMGPAPYDVADRATG
jgi:hypothetical protein